MRATPPGPEREIVQAWADVFADLGGEINRWSRRIARGQRPLTVSERRRVAKLLRVVGTLTGNAYDVEAWLMDRVTLAAHLSSVITARALPVWAWESARTAAGLIGWGTPNQAALMAVLSREVGPVTADYRRLTQATQAYLEQSLGSAVATGEGPRELARRITRVVDVVPRRGQARSVMVARTTLARAYDVGTGYVYREAHAAGVVYGWRWHAQYDACPVCIALNGAIFSVDEGTHRHPNCRCVMEPITYTMKASDVPYGDRWEPYPGTQAAYQSLELVTSPSGWTNWRLPGKREAVPLRPAAA